MASETASNAEAKQQGIIETVQAAGNDPQSNIQPELAEKKLVEESRKAGAPAFQFNPDSDPQKKAEAAKSVGCRAGQPSPACLAYNFLPGPTPPIPPAQKHRRCSFGIRPGMQLIPITNDQ